MDFEVNTKVHRFKKENISIKTIGKPLFWLGVFIGVLTAVILSFSFSYFREVFRGFSQIFTDLLILSETKIWFYNYFFSCLSSFLGLSMTLWVWMQTKYEKRRKHRLLKRTSRMFQVHFFWYFLFIITRFCFIIGFSFLISYNPDYFYESVKDYNFIFFLIPIFIFFKNWSVVQLVFKCRKWMIYSFAITLTLTIILAIVSRVDQFILNETYKKKYAKEYQYIDDEVKKACENYGIKLNAKTIKTLKERNSDAAQLQVYKVREAFNLDTKVSLDTIILQRMIIHNFKENRSYFNENDQFQFNRWIYVRPFQIKNQLKYFNEEDNEAIELFKLLREIENVAYFNYTVENKEDLNETDYRKYLFSENQINTIGFNVSYVIFTDQDIKAKFPSLLNILYFNPEK